MIQNRIFPFATKNCSQFNYATMVIMFGSCKVTFQNLSQSHEGLWKVGIDTYAQINAYFHLNVLDKQFANIARPEIPFEGMYFINWCSCLIY